jgi:hypothetical protein
MKNLNFTKSIQTIRLSIPITMRSLKWIGQGVLNLQHNIRKIGIDNLTVCILFDEITIFHSRVMGLYSSNCRQFFVCRAVNWEPLRQFTSNFVLLLELIVFTDFSKNVVFNCIKIEILQTVRPSIPITLWNLKWIGQGVLKLDGRTDGWTVVYHNTSRLKDGRIKKWLVKIESFTIPPPCYNSQLLILSHLFYSEKEAALVPRSLLMRWLCSNLQPVCNDS